MLNLTQDGDSLVLGSSISLIKVIHRQGTEYYMAEQENTCPPGKGWTMLSNGNGVMPLTVGNVMSENVEDEIRRALKAGLESMGVKWCGNSGASGNFTNNHNFNNNKCMNNLNDSVFNKQNTTLGVIHENEEPMVSQLFVWYF